MKSGKLGKVLQRLPSWEVAVGFEKPSSKQVRVLPIEEVQFDGAAKTIILVCKPAAAPEPGRILLPRGGDAGNVGRAGLVLPRGVVGVGKE